MQLRVGAGVYKNPYEVCATKNDGEDESGLSAAGAFVDVSTLGQQCPDSPFVAGRNGLRQWNGRTHHTIPINFPHLGGVVGYFTGLLSILYQKGLLCPLVAQNGGGTKA